MLTATLRLFSEESGSSDYSPKTGETIAEIRRSGQYNGEEQQQAAGRDSYPCDLLGRARDFAPERGDRP